MDRHGYTRNIRNLCKLEPSTHPVEKKLSSDRSVQSLTDSPRISSSLQVSDDEVNSCQFKSCTLV